MANSASELIWVCTLLSELGIQQLQPPVIDCDNIGSTYLSANPVFHTRLKHVGLDFHYIRELVQHQKLRVSHVSTTDQLTDSLTKPLSKARLQLLEARLESPRVLHLERGYKESEYN